MSARRPLSKTAPLAVALALGCAPSPLPVCRVDADCASGVCRPDGTCAPVAAGDAGGPTDGGSGNPNDAGARADSGSPFDAGNPPPNDGGVCVPAHDGTITRDRTPLEAGLTATFLIAEDAGFDTTGTPSEDGGLLWDLSVAFPGDHSVAVSTSNPSTYWFANDFPNATYVSPLSDTSNLLGIFQATSDSLLLLGIATPTNAYPQTEVSYSPAVTVLSFPLQVGASWQTQATVTGFYLGVYGVYSEKYEMSVDSAGTLKAPYGTFDVLRIRSLLTRTVGLVVTTVHSFSFAADCFGPVAQITSKDDEPNVEFTTAAELRRLGP